MMKRHLSFVTVSVFAALVLLATPGLHAADFYQGKTVRITIGTSPGGGYDAWGRVVSRHIGKHIPGNPTVIVENMPGAGGLIQINNLFAATKPDGLTVGYILGALLLTQALDQPGYHFDPQKFTYIGSVNRENIILALGKKAGITTAAQWRASPVPVKFGGTSKGSAVDNYLRMVKDVLGFPMQVVSGYKGTTEVRLALEGGEVGGGAPSWDSAKTSWKALIDKGDVTIFAVGAGKRLKELPNAPVASEFARTDEEKRIFGIVVDSQNDYSRVFAVPPGTPKDRAEILHKAFEKMVKDPEFLAEVAKMQVTLEYSSAEEVTSAVSTLGKLDSNLKAKLKKILFD
jgi:tripartite-type tricarboxylate transporter receptor subunit TctC